MSTLISAQPRPVRFSQAMGAELNAERYDAGSPAFLLIHGGGDGAFVWDLFAPVLARRFTTLAVDLRGHGDSGWATSGGYRTSGFVEDLVHVIDHSNLRDFVLIGHSLGAEIAIHVRARYAERVIASVLVDFAPELNSEGTGQATLLIRQSLQFYETVGQYANWLKQTRLLAEPALLERVAARSLRRDGDGFRLKLDPAFVDAFDGLLPHESQLVLWDLLRRQSCPTLVVRGGGSAVLSRATANRVVEVLPCGELAIVNGAGHAVMLDNAAGFERSVLGFVEKVLSTRARESV